MSLSTAFERKNITAYCRDLVKILKQAEELNEKLTPLKLIDSWLGKGAAKLRVAGIAPPTLPREDLEKIIAHFLIQQYLKYVQTHFLSFHVVFMILIFITATEQRFCICFMRIFKRYKIYLVDKSKIWLLCQKVHN